MNDNDIYGKTEAGLAEVRTRGAGVSQRLRSVLIMVDGERRVGELRQAAATLGLPGDALDSLAKLQLITLRREAASRPAASAPAPGPIAAPAPPPSALPADPVERFRVAKSFMNDAVVDALGLRAFMFTLKLERCGTVADVASLTDECVKLLSKARGPDAGRIFGARMRTLVG